MGTWRPPWEPVGRRRTMRRVGSVVGIVVLLVTMGVIAVPAAAQAAGATECDGILAAGHYGQVVVPDDAACFSQGPITIEGGLWIGSGATFVLGSEESGWTTGTINDGVHAED